MKLAALLLAIALVSAPSSVGADPALPQIECTYRRTTDDIVQLYVTRADAWHLNAENEAKLPRVISPDTFLASKGDPLGRCDIWRNGDEIDLPITQSQMWAFHLQYLAREAQELPTRIAP